MKVRELNWANFAEPLRRLATELGEIDAVLYGKVNPNHFAPAWGRMMQHCGAVAFSGHDDDGRVCSWLGGLIVPDMFTGEMQALEFLWLARPGVSGAALSVLSAFESKAINAGAKMVIAGSSAFRRPEAMRRLYRRLGYVPHAEAFRKVL